MFWPEQDQSGARHALRNALYNLRRQLGEAVIANRGTEEVGIAEDLLWCDAVAFEQAIEAGEPGVAVDLYSGDLLHGFFLSDSSPSFDHWLERERTRLQLRAADAAWQLATAAEREGKAARAVEMARKALTLRPDDEPWLRKVLALLYRLGDQAGALRTYEEFAARLTNEFEVEPAPETRALIRQVRERRPTAPEFVMPRRSSGADSHGPATDPPASPPHPAPIADQVPPMVEREPQPRRRRLLAIVLVLVACLAIALFALR
jgi:DNA-binding SARP family transcriptional activator